MKSYVFIAWLLVGSWSAHVKSRLRDWHNIRDSKSNGGGGKMTLQDLALCAKKIKPTSYTKVNTMGHSLEVGDDGYDGFHEVSYDLPHEKCVSGLTEDGRALRFKAPDGARPPDHVDWRQLGAVTGVKDQGRCQSCWAFSAVGALEGQHFLKTGELVDLSVQNLVDCAGEYGTFGCGGGSMVNAFRYVSDTEGLLPAKAYPYRGKNGRCHYKRKLAHARVKGVVLIESGNEQQLMEAVAFVGPISAAIDASWKSFRHYRHGVYYEQECRSDRRNLTHAVLVVGYGTDRRLGADYWIVKNSLGSDWGEGGYIRMARNRDNNCGIATSASYPLL